MTKARLWLLVGVGLLLIVAGLMLSPLLSTPSPVSTLVLTSTPTIVPPSTRVAATWDVSRLSTVTPPAPGEPTLPPEALTMHAAPTATPSPIIHPTNTPDPTATPTPVPVTGSDDVLMMNIPSGEFIMGATHQQVSEWLGDHYAQFAYAPRSFVQDETPQLRINLGTFSIDQLEVTNARYRRCVSASICQPSYLTKIRVNNAPLGYAADTQYDNYPALVTWNDANTYCQWVGKRLPSEAEWEKAARGMDGRWYPWGNNQDASRANVAIGANGLNPVGSHPDGASPYGVLDMAGNAWEWTSDHYAPYPGQPEPNIFPSIAPEERVARGRVEGPGATTFREAELPDKPPWWSVIGFRCTQGPYQVWQTKVVSTSLPLLPTPSRVDLSDMVYVPAGEFIMGATEPLSYSQPARIVYLDEYYIDRYEVTVQQFANFLNAIGGHLYTCGGHTCTSINSQAGIAVIGLAFSDGRYKPKSGEEYLPASEISWYGAQTFCAWVGKQLPTEAQWEKGARGTDGRKYPWGNDWHPDWVALTSEPPSPVGSHPHDQSPYGAMDMLGNAEETVLDWFSTDYYKRSPYANSMNEEPGESGHVNRGPAGAITQDGLPIRLTGTRVGFRCAYTPH